MEEKRFVNVSENEAALMREHGMLVEEKLPVIGGIIQVLVKKSVRHVRLMDYVIAVSPLSNNSCLIIATGQECSADGFAADATQATGCLTILSDFRHESTSFSSVCRGSKAKGAVSSTPVIRVASGHSSALGG